MPSSLLKKMPQPNEKQRLAFLDGHRYVAYGGARGGGKSWFVRWKAVLMALKYPGIKILITRKTYRELLNNHILPLQAILFGIGKYIKSEKRFLFPNGSTIWFGYCADEGDLGQYQGAEFDIWFADEAGQFLEGWLTAIDACVRGTNGFPKRTYYTLNPGGPSHGYFKRLFIDKVFREGEYPEDYSFIQALCTDNAALMKTQPEYLRSLEKLPSKLRDAWLFGRWDIFEGQFFEDLRLTPDASMCAKAGITPEEARQQRRFTHVIEPFDLNSGQCRGWSILRSYDFGYNKPFSLGYWAVDYQDALNQYYAQLDRLQGIYDNERAFDYGKWADGEDFAYGQYRDDVADQQWQSAFDYQQAQDLKAYEQWLQEFQYQQEQDRIAQEQWQKEFEENQRRYNQEWAASQAKSTGRSSGSSKTKAEKEVSATEQSAYTFVDNMLQNATSSRFDPERVINSTNQLTGEQKQIAKEYLAEQLNAGRMK